MGTDATRKAGLRRVLIALLTLDLALIGAHGLAGAAVVAGGLADIPRLLDIEHPRSLAGIVGCAMWAGAAVLFLAAWTHRREPAMLALALVTAMIFADDTFGLHEALARPLADLAAGGAPVARGATDLAELAVFGAMGIVAVGVLGLAAGADQRRGRREIAVFLGLLALLACTGAGLDFVHATMDPRTGPFAPIPYRLVGLAEDGGELLLASAVLWLACRSTTNRGGPDAAADPAMVVRSPRTAPGPGMETLPSHV